MQPLYNKIYLLGFMGAGKSTVGPLVAKALGILHFDSDQEIEKREGLRISQIIAARGEEYFRDCETACLAELADSPQVAVVALGGGTLLREVNRQRVQTTGVQIYLQASVKTLAERTLAQGGLRPLLPPESLNERMSRISSLFVIRRNDYEKADFAVVTDGLSPRAVCELILSLPLGDLTGINSGSQL